MHISEFQLPSNTILTKCTKMTEEGHNLHGMNGNADRNIKEECHKTNYGQGGRLKFFKDGKFILELERAREGERVSWVSVPRKTFWPPQGTASSTPAYRQESSTSLSVSDDNSSIQSSPWQRDHTWKQTNPSHNVSKEMMFFFWRPKGKIFLPKSKKLRSPYSTSPEPVSWNEPRPIKVKREYTKRSLLEIVQSLIEKNYRISTSPRSETMVSPRKRFLREMEKDKVGHAITAEDYGAGLGGGCLKRSRSKPQQQAHVNHHQPSIPSLSQIPSSNAPQVVTNGDVRPTTRNCSYSITSLLSEDRRRSPSSSPGHYSPVAAANQPYHTPGPDDRWYSESVDRLRSIELSHAEKHHSTYQSPYHHPHVPPSYLGGPYVYPFPPPPPGPPFFYGGRGYVPAVYHHHHQAISRRDTWIIGGSPRIGEGEPKEETVSDMPLNLSKHSG